MGNRFAALPEYQTIITGHGVLAAITFLFIVPTAITVACFYHANPRLALRIHIALQTLTVILVTIVFILGWFAVGPERSLTNPHHIIGLTIYVLILIQAIGGWLIKKIEKGKIRYHIPLKLMVRRPSQATYSQDHANHPQLHQWIGRSIALLALAQIPIGLTLYGSPAYLFVLYSLVVAAWILLYFTLTYQSHKRSAMVPYDNMEGSYVTGGTGVSGSASNVSHHPDRHKLEALAATLGLGAAIAAYRRRRSSQKEHRRTESGTDMIPRPAGSDYTEKLSESQLSYQGGRPPPPRNNSNWRDRVMAGAAGVGAAGLAARFLGRRRDDDYDDRSRYDSQTDLSYNRPPPQSGSFATGSGSQLTRMEEGGEAGVGYQPPSDHWEDVERREAAQAAGAGAHGPNRSEASFYTDYSQDDRRRSGGAGRFGLGALGGLAGVAGIRGWLNRRRSKKEDRRAAAQQGRRHDDRDDDSSFYSGPSAPYTDNSPRKGRQQSPTTEVTQTNTDYNRHLGGPPMASGALNHPRRSSASSVMAPPHPPPSNIPPPPPAANLGPPPPSHHDSFSSIPSGSNDLEASYASPSHQRRPRRYSEVSRPTTGASDRVHEPLGGPGYGAHNDSLDSGVLSPPPPINPDGGSRGRSSAGSPNSRGNVASPSIAVNVKMSPDGRHVTLRRLNEEEAAAKRAQQERAWRRERREGSQSRSNISPAQMASGSGSPAPGPSRLGPTAGAGGAPVPMPSGPGHSPIHSYLSAAAPAAQGLGPPPVRAPGSASPGETSPGGIEGSGMSSYDENRRRRRAERARAEQARARNAGGKGGGQRVDFA